MTINNYEICERSGFKLKPGEAHKDWTGRLVHPRFVDKEPFRESLKHRVEDQQGAVFSEHDDVFISTSVSPEDL